MARTFKKDGAYTFEYKNMACSSVALYNYDVDIDYALQNIDMILMHNIHV